MTTESSVIPRLLASVHNREKMVPNVEERLFTLVVLGTERVITLTSVLESFNMFRHPILDVRQTG